MNWFLQAQIRDARRWWDDCRTATEAETDDDQKESQSYKMATESYPSLLLGASKPETTKPRPAWRQAMEESVLEKRKQRLEQEMRIVEQEMMREEQLREREERELKGKENLSLARSRSYVKQKCKRSKSMGLGPDPQELPDPSDYLDTEDEDIKLESKHIFASSSYE